MEDEYSWEGIRLGDSATRNIQKHPLQHRGKSATTMKKGYCNILSTITATSEKRLLQQIYCNIRGNLLQQRKKVIATSQTLLL
jgi:hypothetical protein